MDEIIDSANLIKSKYKHQRCNDFKKHFDDNIRYA